MDRVIGAAEIITALGRVKGDEISHDCGQTTGLVLKALVLADTRLKIFEHQRRGKPDDTLKAYKYILPEWQYVAEVEMVRNALLRILSIIHLLETTLQLKESTDAGWDNPAFKKFQIRLLS